MKIIQTDRIEIPTPKHPNKLGLLINVHLSERCIDQDEMKRHAVNLLGKETVKEYAGLAVVFWLQSEGKKERLFSHEI